MPLSVPPAAANALLVVPPQEAEEAGEASVAAMLALLDQ